MSPTLAELTTLRLGGPAGELVEAVDRDTLLAALAEADGRRRAVLVVAGGSNLVVADEGWPGLVVLVRHRGIQVQPDGDHVLVTAAAGEPWDGLVQRAIAEGWAGLETMSGIPGSVGATPVQNVGAYGREIAELITGLTVYDRRTTATEVWSPQRCGFGFRTSAFKHTDQFVVLDVTLRLPRGSSSLPIRYLELAGRLGIEQDAVAPTTEVRAAVMALRRGKGMVLDAADHDSWSVGSFFVNPLVEVLPEAAKDCPHWPTAGGIKLSAAWLIERAGFPRGYGRGHVAVSTKHTLALTNRGGATTAELLDLAAEIRAGVEQRFGVRLRPEAHLAGVEF